MHIPVCVGKRKKCSSVFDHYCKKLQKEDTGSTWPISHSAMHTLSHQVLHYKMFSNIACITLEISKEYK